MDTHGMKFVVDTTGVAKGFRDYKSAVDGIFASLSKFEAHVDKTMKGVAKASANPQALNAFKRAVSAFAKVDIDTSAARKLSALSAAMNGFKAPSAAQTNNTKRFFNVLGNTLPDLSKAYRSIKMMNDLKAAMNGFRAPPASASKNLAAFADAMRTAAPAFAGLRNVSGTARVANELALLGTAFKNLRVPSAGQVTNLGNFALAMRSFNFSNLGSSGNFYAALGAIGNFRAPSPAQIRNLQNFVNAVATMRTPPNAQAVAAALNTIASAAGRASASMGGLRAGMGSLGHSMGYVGSQARGASLQMMGLQNAFSGTFQVGSMLRSLLGSLTIAELGRNFFAATNAAIAFRAQMGVINTDLQFIDSQMTYISETANKFGVDMLGAAQGFAKISIAADKSGISVMATRHIFEGMSSAMTVLGTTTSGQQDVWLALQQVMNKGYLSAEELNQQLNEKLPGAMAYATEYANSLGLSLEKGLKTKALDAAGVLAHIAKRMKEDFGPAVANALMRPAAQMNILRNNFNQLFIAIGEAGGNTAFSNLLLKINERMKPEDIERYAKAIGEGLSNAVDKLAAGFDWLYENWDSIKGPLSTTLSIMGKWMIISSALQIGRFIVQPLMMVGTALGGLRQAGLLMQMLIAPTAQASTAITGGFQRAAVSVYNFRNSLISSVAAMRATTAASGPLAAGLTMVARAGGLAAAGMRGLIGMLGGPYLLAFAAAAYAAYSLYSDFTEGNKVIRTNSNFLAEQRTKLDETKNALDRVTGATVVARGATTDNNSIVQTGIAFMNDYHAKINAATGGLWDMARAARAATIENLKLQQADVTKRLSQIGMQSSSLLMRSAGDLWDHGQYGNSTLAVGRAGLMGLKSGLGFGPSQDEVNSQFADTARMRNDINAQLARAEGTSDEDWLREYQRAFPNGLSSNTGGGRSLSGEESGSKRRGRRQPTFEERANRVENAVDGLMDKLMQNDPIGALYQDFVKTLTDQAHVLLNDTGYTKFIANLREDSKDGEVSVESLISVMGDAGNLSAEAMADIEARYGKSSGYIIQMLHEQQVALEDAYKEAAIKELDRAFRSLAKGLDMLGDSLPAIGEMKSNLDTIEGLARFVMPADEGFLAFLTDLRSGTISAADAMTHLNAIMADPSRRSTQANQFFAMADTTPEEVAAAQQRRLAANANTRREAELDLQFGERMLQQRSNEIKMLGMSSQEAEAYSTVMDEVNRVRALGIPISQQHVDGLLSEVRAQQALANQMQRNKEFFENNGVRTYINDIKSVGESINELDKNVLQSLEDQLFSLGTTGKFSFQAIFDTLQQGLIRFASQNLLKEGLGKLFGGDELEGGTPSLVSGIMGAMGFKHEAGDTNKLGVLGNPMYVRLDPMSGNLFGQGPGTVSLVDGINDASGEMLDGASAVGGIIRDQWGNEVKGIGGILGQIAGGLGSSMGGGGGGLLGSLIGIGMSAFGIPGGNITGSLAGDAAATIAANPGIFKEGGYPGAPVSRMSVHPAAFTNAPHYAEGTPNTSGGHPAILHDNEAVIPLSRGRKVAVELAGGSRGQVINNNFAINTPDANSFRKSKQQIATQMHMQAGRAFKRNHG